VRKKTTKAKKRSSIITKIPKQLKKKPKIEMKQLESKYPKKRKKDPSVKSATGYPTQRRTQEYSSEDTHWPAEDKSILECWRGGGKGRKGVDAGTAGKDKYSSAQ